MAQWVCKVVPPESSALCCHHVFTRKATCCPIIACVTLPSLNWTNPSRKSFQSWHGEEKRWTHPSCLPVYTVWRRIFPGPHSAHRCKNRVPDPQEREASLQSWVTGSSEWRESSERQPWVFLAQRETKLHERHGKLERGQNRAKGTESKQKNSC